MAPFSLFRGIAAPGRGRIIAGDRPPAPGGGTQLARPAVKFQ